MTREQKAVASPDKINSPTESADFVSANNEASTRGLTETLDKGAVTGRYSQEHESLPEVSLNANNRGALLEGPGSFKPSRVERNADGSAVLTFDNGLKIEMEPLGGEGAQSWRSTDLSIVDARTGEEESLEGSVRVENQGSQELIDVEYEGLSMSMRIDRAKKSMVLEFNDDTRVRTDANGNIGLRTPTHDINLRSDGNYRERDLRTGTTYNVDSHGIVTNISADGSSSHSRLSVKGTEGAELQNLQHDHRTGEVYANFSDGTRRQLYFNDNRLKSAWEEQGADGKTKERIDVLTTDDFARSHLMSRIFISKTLHMPDVGQVSGFAALGDR